MRRDKYTRIRAILDAGHRVEHLVLRDGLDDAKALMAEQAVIDAHRATGEPLTNLIRGHESTARGLATMEMAAARHAPRPAPPPPMGTRALSPTTHR